MDIDKANAEACERMMESRPLVVGLGKALEVIPGMRENLLLHAGPPITWERASGPMRGAITGALIFGRFLAITRLPFMVADFVAALPVSPYVILAIILLIYMIGGCFVDALGFLVLTIPIFFPLGMALGFDPIWYSIVITMVTTMGAITPPVGVNIYVVKALAPEIPLGTIFKSASFFLLACIVCTIILIIFPEIVLVIPNMVH